MNKSIVPEKNVRKHVVQENREDDDEKYLKEEFDLGQDLNKEKK
jgi:hypothetical protein